MKRCKTTATVIERLAASHFADGVSAAWIEVHESGEAPCDAQFVIRAKRRQIDFYRREKRERAKIERYSILGDSLMRQSEKSTIDEVQSRDLQHTVREAVAILPPKYRVTVALCDLAGWSIADVSRKLGVPVDTVKTRLGRARLQLRKNPSLQRLAQSWSFSG